MNKRIFNPDFSSFEELDAASKTEPVKTPVFVAPFIELTSIDLNLEAEILIQYNRARRLLHAAEYDETIPLNQKAQALNSATAILAALTKSQGELHSIEKVRKIEAALIKTLKAFPEVNQAFLDEYEGNLNDK